MRSQRTNIFHLMSTVNAHDVTVNMGAKGLHGEGYRGHIFWDTEVYLLPFFTYTWPEAARTLLMYRYHLLNGARENAALNGQKGARYAWESTDTGQEVCVKWCMDIMGKKIRCWCGEIEIFVSSAVAFGIYEYFRITNDISFMLDYGIEVIVETARYWASACTYNPAQDRYELPDVIGPDEFHSHVDNNFYTNYFARWNIAKAGELLDMLQLDYPARHQALQAHIENTQLIKQPDVVMAMLLLSEEFDDETKRINYEFYKPRTTHKSSLSASASALMGLKVGDTAEAYQSFLRTAETDLVDNQGNAHQGLHLASTGGTWQVAVLGFAGMTVNGDGFLCFEPQLPDHWQQMAFKVWWRGTLLQVVKDQHEVQVQGLKGNLEDLKIKVGEVR